MAHTSPFSSVLLPEPFSPAIPAIFYMTIDACGYQASVMPFMPRSQRHLYIECACIYASLYYKTF